LKAEFQNPAGEAGACTFGPDDNVSKNNHDSSLVIKSCQLSRSAARKTGNRACAYAIRFSRHAIVNIYGSQRIKGSISISDQKCGLLFEFYTEKSHCTNFSTRDMQCEIEPRKEQVLSNRNQVRFWDTEVERVLEILSIKYVNIYSSSKKT
jgi:hypothetical protein